MTKTRVLCDVGGCVGSVLVVAGLAQSSIGAALVAAGVFILLWSMAYAVSYKLQKERNRVNNAH